jgi:hypothetical protein
LIVQFPDGKPESTTLPVATEQVGWVIVPTTGLEGGAGAALIIAFADAGEVHPTELVTVKLYVAAASPEIVVLVVLPVIPPGFIVQLPAGSPLRATLPVARAQVGWVIVPIAGAAGAPGTVLITTLDEAVDIQPAALVTVKLYVPGASPDIVVLVPDPVCVPGSIVQFPVAGSPFNTTLPVGAAHVGWVIAPAEGAEGVTGGEFIITGDEPEVHPAASVTV